jgi:hypothetical protein
MVIYLVIFAASFCMFVRLQPHFGLSALNIIYYEFSLGVEIERGGVAEVLLL